MTGFSAKFKLPCFKINSFITSSFLIFYYLSAVAVFRTAPPCQDP